MASDPSFHPAIAVVGASALFPGSPDGASFWRNILAGRDLLTDVPADHWLVEDYFDADPSAPGKTYARRGGFLPEVDFDPLRHGLPPKQLSTTDTAQLLALVVAQHVLDDAASVHSGKVDRAAISVILGVASATELVGQMAARIQRPHWVKALRDAGLPESRVVEICDRIEATYPEWDESTFPGLLGNVVAGRIANRLDLGGTNCVVDAACASSLGAVAMAVQELQLGHSDLVITGGVDALNDIFMYMCFSKTPALSPTGDCRPFAEAADGTMLGEGIGMLALRRLADAERDGDRIYAVLRGVGSSSDGRAKSIYAPRAAGQQVAIRRAYERAGYGPGDVGLIEAHGTATKAGDLAEFEGLTRAFDDVRRPDRQWCALGSVKSQIGHTKAAAGSASLFKVVMALHHKVLPPTIKVDRPSAKLEIERSPFYLNTRARPWIEAPGRTRKGSVSSFGFGGSNFHLTLEEYVGSGGTRRRTSALPTHLLLLGGDDAASLLSRAETLRADLAATALPVLARRSQLAFDPRSLCRLAVLADDAEQALARLATSVASVETDGSRPFSIPGRAHYAAGGDRPKIAFLFPGQGSQYVEMGAGLAMEFEAARRVWDESAMTELEGGRRLHEVVFPVPAFSDEERDRQGAELTRTDRAQPAIGAASVSTLRVLEGVGVRPDATAGHSYGEIPALHAAGAIESAAQVLAISSRRGELMRQAASVPGAMTAIRAGAAEVEALLARTGAGGVTLANLNGPRQVVVAGETPAVEAFEVRLAEEGLSFRRLPVDTAFHTGLVAPSAEPFGRFLAEIPFRAPVVPVYSNSTAEPYGTDAGAIRDTLARQLARPVRFQEMIERMYADGCRLFVEVGPGSVLTGLAGECLAGRPHVAVATDVRGRDGRTGLLDVLGVCSVQGVAVDYAAFWEEFAPLEAGDAPVERSAATVRLSGANYGKPYPPRQGASGRTAPNPEPVEAPAVAAPVPVTPSLPEPPPPVAAQRASRPAAEDPGWSAAFIALQQQTLEAQKEFTRTLAESHQAFLRASEAAFAQLGSLGGTGAAELRPAPRPAAAVPPLPAAPAAPPAPVARPAPLPELADVAPGPLAPAVRGPDHAALLFAVVAEKTGYPVEMLEPSMELEAGLGIDSIKRVEILSVLQEKVPELAGVDPAELASLNTLGEIIGFASRVTASPARPPVAGVASPSPSAAPAAAPAPPLRRLVVEWTGTPAPGLVTPGLADAAPLYLVGGDPAISAPLAEALDRIGIRVARASEAPADARAVVLLAGLDPVGDAAAARTALNEAVFLQLKRCAGTMASGGGGLLVTVQDTGGDFGIAGLAGDRAWSAGIAAAAKTAAVEWPAVSVKAIDVETEGRSPAEIAGALYGELLLGGPQLEVGLRADGRRGAPCLREEEDPAPRAAPMDPEGVLVVTGGGRGVTAACVAELLARSPGRVVVLGRTPLVDEPEGLDSLETDAQLKEALLRRHREAGRGVSPTALGAEVRAILAGRELRRNLEALSAHPGARVRYHAVDVTSPAEVVAALAAIRETFGPIRGLVHAAGVLADREIERKEPDQFRRVFGTKVDGLRNLLDATREDDLTHLVCFSSVAAWRGNVGQVDYAMANEILNRVCRVEARRRGPGCLVKAIGWGPWAGGMVDAGLEKHFTARGVALIPLEEGARVFADEFAGANGGAPEIVVGGGSDGFGRRIDAEPMERDFHVRFHRTTHPHLADHAIHDDPVVPVVAVNELALQAVRAFLPGAPIAGTAELAVRNGIVLRRFDTDGDRVRVECRRTAAAEDRVAVRLVSPDGLIHYTLDVLLGDASADGAPPAGSPRGLAPWRPATGEIYDGRLFHGPAFQVIRSLDGISDAGCIGVLRSTRRVGAELHLDPEVVDGGLQLAVLWIHERMGCASLPTGFGAFRLHGRAAPGEPVRCEALCTARTSLATSWTILYLTAAGEPICSLHDVRIHLLPRAEDDPRKRELSVLSAHD